MPGVRSHTRHGVVCHVAGSFLAKGSFDPISRASLILVFLEQGNYGRAWNCVIINKRETVIDLMGNPGEFYPLGTQQSSDYLSL